MTKTPADAYAAAIHARIVRELREFVRIPSVSADPGHAADVRRCADWLAGHLRGIGMPRVRIFPTARHPIVYADCLRRPGLPTLLIYGHYDVQPADPLGEWRTPPFEPTIIGERLFARGATDDKGQLFAHVKALEAYLKTSRLPVNVKCLFEGEEEIGSKHLHPFIRRNRRALKADAVVISDMKILGPDQPSIAISLRGTLALELTVRGARTDLHSGNFGGMVHNPIQALGEIISRLHDPDGRIAIPGIYDMVAATDGAERARMRRQGPGDRTLMADAGTRAPWGEPGWSLYERITVRPALTINGISGGYQGEGAKAVIPSYASAKLSFRLVPNQEPDEIERLFRAFVTRITPPTVKVNVHRVMAGPHCTVDPRHPAMRAAAAAYRHGFGASPVLTRLGGSIPVANTFQQALGIPALLMGFGLPDANLHAPNENLHLPTFFKAIRTCTALLNEFATLHRPHARGMPSTNGNGALRRRSVL